MSIIQWINHTCFMTEDMERALKFYRDVLGMTVDRDAVLEGEYFSTLFGSRNTRGRVVYLGIGDMRHGFELVEFYNPRIKLQNPPIPLGAPHLGIIVDSVERVYKELSAKGIKFASKPVYRPGEVPYPWSKGGIFCQDPDGNWVEFLERAPAPPGTRIV